ncbi:MAG: zinc-dependent metalloprotease [Acidimicrobiales bacterium]
MATNDPPEGPTPEGFGGILGDLMRALGQLGQQGPLSWDVARQLAVSVATDGEAEANVDPIERMKLEELGRIAELHVSDATGLTTSHTGHLVRITPVTRSEWATRSLDAHRPALERLARAMGDPGGAVAEGTTGDPLSSALANISQLMGPMMLGATAGSMVGHRARQALGQHDLPLPWPPSDEVLVVSANVARLARDWSLPEDDVALWVCLRELTHHAVLGRPHVRDRMDSLLGTYVDGFRFDAAAFGGDIEGLDLSDPQAIQSLLGDPKLLTQSLSTPQQEEPRARLAALGAAVTGYVDHVLDATATRLVGSSARITEAWRRVQATPSEADRLVAHLLGLEVGPGPAERGAAFVDGVIQRAGEDGLRRLWLSELELPTPAEVDAPGLWLARIELPGD